MVYFQSRKKNEDSSVAKKRMSRNDTENESVKEDKVEEKNKNNVPDNSKDKKVYYTFLFNLFPWCHFILFLLKTSVSGATIYIIYAFPFISRFKKKSASA
jgi:ATP-dependent Zn protease